MEHSTGRRSYTKRSNNYKVSYTSKAYKIYEEYVRLKYIGSTLGDIFGFELARAAGQHGYTRRLLAKMEGVILPDVSSERVKCYESMYKEYMPKSSYKLTAEQLLEYIVLREEALAKLTPSPFASK